MASDEGRHVRDGDVEEQFHDAVQEALPLDEPVPYRLTTMGRRVVAPEQVPRLRVVTPLRVASHTDLDADGGTLRVRARALRHTGMHTLDIADELEVDPLHVELWVQDLPVPPGAGRARRRRQLAAVREDPVPDVDAAAAAWRAAASDGYDAAAEALAADPTLRTGVALAAGVLVQDVHALLLEGDQLAVLAAALGWVRSCLPPSDAPVRALVRHAPDVAGDRIAHDVATALGIDLAAVATSRDPARAGREPHVRLRCSDPVLAGHVVGWQRALLTSLSAPDRPA